MPPGGQGSSLEEKYHEHRRYLRLLGTGHRQTCQLAFLCLDRFPARKEISIICKLTPTEKLHVMITVQDKDLARLLRRERLLTSSLRHEPSFKHSEEEDVQPQSKKARQMARFEFEELLPLSLSVEEALTAQSQGLVGLKPLSANTLQVVAKDQAKQEPAQVKHDRDAKLAVFQHLWSAGFTLVDGLKFGVDYLAYRRDPLKFHAEYMVSVTGSPPSLLELTRMCAVSAKASKSLLLAHVDEFGLVECIVVSRCSLFGMRGSV